MAEKHTNESGAKPLKVVLIDVLTPGLDPGDRIKEVVLDVEDGYNLKPMYRYLQCDSVEHTRRPVGGRWLDMYVDEEGLYRDPLVLGAWNGRNDDRMDGLAGNILIVGPVDDEGWDTDVPEGTMDLVRRNVIEGERDDGPNVLLIIGGGDSE